jgi:hypothetical protein
VLLLDSEGKERARREGYLPNKDSVAALMSGLGRIAFVQKKYSDAERLRIESVNRVFALTLTFDLEFGPSGRAGGNYSPMIPRFNPIIAACVRSLAPNLERMFLTRPLTVSSVIES